MKNLYLFLFGAVLLFSRCSECVPVDYGSILINLSDYVILPSYKGVKDKADILYNKCLALHDVNSPEYLEAAQKAWREFRIPWEYCENYNFGPLKNKGFDNSMDAWPLSPNTIDSILRDSTINLTSDFFYTEPGSVKGAHLIEYILWGIDGHQSATNITKRQREYVRACAENMSNESGKLYDNWRCGSGYSCFINNVKEAGTRGIYTSQIQALLQLVNNNIGSFDDCANRKLTEAVNKNDIYDQESYFSDNTKNDILYNLEAIQFIYLGKYKDGTGNGLGLTTIVVNENPELDSKIRLEISAAIAAVNAIPETYNTAFVTKRNPPPNVSKLI
jgi:putative iron-regulated protein